MLRLLQSVTTLVVFTGTTTTSAAIPIRTVAYQGQPVPGLSGVTFQSFIDEPFLDSNGAVSFSAQLHGGLTNPYESNTIWLNSSNSYDLVARGDSQALGMASGLTFTNLTNKGLSSGGHAAFYAGVAGGGLIGTHGGYWSGKPSDLHSMFQIGDTASGLPVVATFGSARSIAINTNGQSAFRASFSRFANDYQEGIWTEEAGTLNLIAYLGQHAAGLPAGVTYQGLGNPGINSSGKVAFDSYLGGTDSGYDRAIWSNAYGPLALVARTGEHAPGTPDGVNFNDIGWDGLVALNASGDLVFKGTLSGPGIDYTNNDGVWRQTAGSLSLIARAGDQAPDLPEGTKFGHLLNPALNSVGNVVFFAYLSGSEIDLSNFRSLWIADGGKAQLVVRTGQQAPGMPAGIVFGSVDDTPLLNSAGQVAFGASLAGEDIDITNDSSIWITDKFGVPQLVVREGQQLEVTPGEFRTIAQIYLAGDGGSDDESESAFNARGQFAFRAYFTDNTTGIFVSEPTVVPEPGGLTLGLFVIGGACRRRTVAHS